MGPLIQYLVYKIFEISSVSYFEYISLVGHYNKLLYQEQVDPQLLTRGYTQAQLDEVMKHKRSSPKELISCNLHFKGSLDQWDNPYFDYLLVLFNQYNRKGVLPFPGGLSSQPAKIIEIFQLLEQLDHERQEKQRREEERKQSKNRQGKRR